MARRGDIVYISWAPHWSRSDGTAAGLGWLRVEKLRTWRRNATRLRELAGVEE